MYCVFGSASQLAKTARKLRELRLGHCHKITEHGLAALATHAPKLLSLDLRFCAGVTRLPFEFTNLEQLQYFNIYGTPNLVLPPHLDKVSKGLTTTTLPANSLCVCFLEQHVRG